MEALPFATWFKDQAGNFQLVNNEFLTHLCSERGEVIGKTSREVFEAGDARQSDESDREILHSGETRHVTHSSENRVFQTVHFPVFDNRGRIRGTGGYQEDITNLAESLQVLHKEKEYLEALMENMPFYIFFTDRSSRYIRINRKMAGLLRVSSPGEAIGKDNEAFFSRRVARKMQEEDRRVMETGRPVINRTIYFEDDNVDGFWMEVNKIPIRDEREEVIMLAGIIKDVSDIKRIESELKSARDRAREADRLKSSFLANMSHEIRTPMNGILGFINLMRDPDLGHEQRDLYLKHIEDSSNQLMHIIDDIVDISKIEAGQLKISNKPIRINAILDELFSSYFHRIRGDAPGQKKVAFKLEKGEAGTDYTIVADDYRLRQILQNLIGNAIKFTSEGRITFGYNLLNQRHIEFFVSDTGVGIPADKLDVVFDRFGQVIAAESDQSSGTGLGLPISKSLVELMGGEMWVESKPGEGSTFYFTLPLVTGDAREDAPDLLSNKSYDWKGKTILVAEDEELNWHFLREMLRKPGAEIVRARTGHEAMEIARNQGPDVILMDLKMPEMNGIEAIRQIRSFNGLVPIIAQTAFVMAEEKEESRQAGCNHFVTKPIDRTELMELIDSYFRRP